MSTANAQVLIIGGGAMGVSLTYHLTKAGWTDVVLTEKNDLTHGSTWHAAGLCTHFAHNPTIQELRATSVRLYRDILPEETGDACGFHRSGAMRITSNPDRMDEFAHVAGLSRFTGYELRLLTPADVECLHPLARTEGLLGGIHEPDDGHVDPSLATNAMAKVARRNGATILRRTPVTSIRREDGAWVAETEKTAIRAKHIVNAAGTWGWEIGRMMGLNIPSVPVLHPVSGHRYGSGGGGTHQAGTAGTADHPRPGRKLVRAAGARWPDPRAVRERRAALVDRWLPARIRRRLDAARSGQGRGHHHDGDGAHPCAGNGRDQIDRQGPITFTPDANPLIGPAHGLPNAWLLTGSSMGVMEGGGAGWFLAHWMTHGASPMDPLAVDSRRFGSWADREYRVEKAIECFGLQFGVHYPHEERPAARGKRLSPIHDLMIERGAVMGAAYGWERPQLVQRQARRRGSAELPPLELVPAGCRRMRHRDERGRPCRHVGVFEIRGERPGRPRICRFHRREQDAQGGSHRSGPTP